MVLSVKLDNFEGPLDLLLHLIDKNKLNIYDIPIVVVTKQYLEHMRHMEVGQMEVMSEFIEMAAILINIKSKMLLPKYEEDEEEDEDPRAVLVEKLLEYRKYKMISMDLKERHNQADKILFKEASIPEEVKNYTQAPDTSALLESIDFGKLYQVFQSVLKRNEDKMDVVRSHFGDIKKEAFTVQEKIEQLLNLRENYSSLSFADLLDNLSTKVEMIVTFLAVLELMKMGSIRVIQTEVFDDLIIRFV
ncbi:segregation and condensation protein A [Petrocella sp. FN5]|uniref:segregation and condensation protein A n=1 Tax=Petrocella sp. FN5 TaxID=3032002 RepID=UPI0023DC91A0|nr:segregation/condensation protein A [Petrocella sp. FN5]MDF1617524.1 segregation/condensation protein A [Petrocella sp. FN5]